MTLTVPPPVADEYSAADQARTRLRAKSAFHLFRPTKPRLAPKPPSPPDVSLLAVPGPDLTISLDYSSVSCLADHDHDQYRWAVLYENQRGLKLFSTLYYSRLSLLPTDPSPFTIPSFSLKCSKQPDVSLAVYPLPDGAWRWLSLWMVDMRSDSGEVQHDGFEYNWMFRTHHWHAEVGAMSWVRRRRWVRLMMRPAKHKHPDEPGGSLSPNIPALSGWHEGVKHQYSITSSFPPSVVGSHLEEDPQFEVDVDEVWQAEDDEANWERCRLMMRRAGRDGRKLELWSRWLAEEPQESDSMGKRRQWTEDDELLPSETPAEIPPPSNAPPIERILPALRKHGNTIMHSFVYPESRARFLQILERVGALAELNANLGCGMSGSEVEFWSYMKDVADKGDAGSTPGSREGLQ
ncbi:hypothetical protein B0H10DRAFT_2058532 [Mycena sp. CBHHK59/15]|nr:hypothetical protein B0H10DRAFT_2058532 [Mycena sp. CBHHK59/15]